MKRIFNVTKTSNPVILLAISALLLLIYTFIFSPNIPMSDQWELVSLLKNVDLNDLTAQHNEHRIFFPRLIYLGLAKLSHWNLKYETLISASFFIALIFLIYKAFLKSPISEKGKSIFVFALLVQLSPIHYENLLWGWQLQIMLSVLMFFIAISKIDNIGQNMRSLLFFYFTMFIASFSFLTGLLGWIIGFLSMLRMKNWRFSNMVFFIFTSFLVFLMYFHNFRFANNVPQNVGFPYEIISRLSYFFVYMGANFVPTYKVGRFIDPLLFATGLWGLVFFVFGLYLVVKTLTMELPKTVVPYSMILFGIFCAIITSMGRLESGLQSALLSRYHVFQMFYFLGVIWLLLIYLENLQILGKYRTFLIGLFVFIILSNWISGVALGVLKNKWIKPIEIEMRKGTISNDSAKKIYSGTPKDLQSRINLLRDLSYNTFRELKN